MDAAETRGVSYYYFVKCHGWEYLDDPEGLIAIAQERKEKNLAKKEREERRKEQREERVRQVMEATGWSRDVALRHMDEAEARGVSYYYFVHFHGWDLCEDEILDLAQVIEEKKAAQERNNSYYIDLVQKRTGWSREEVIADMDKRKEEGFSYMRYAQKNLWALSEDQIASALQDVHARSEKTAAAENVHIPKIAEATGWSIGKTLLEVERARAKFGASTLDFFQYRMWELPPEKQRTCITWGLMQKFRISNTDYLAAHHYFDNKPSFNKLFSDVVKHRWFTFDGSTTYDDFEQSIEGLDCLILKPTGSSGGAGIEKLACNVSADSNKALYEKIRAADKQYIIEECIVQSGKMSSLSESSVNTVRIVTLNHNGTCKFLLGCLRMGTGSAVDNLHSGGISAEVDVETGIVCTDGINFEGLRFSHHPVSNMQIRGFEIPHWDILCKTCEEIFDRVEGVNLIGWDFAITDDGVDVIEGNAGSGYDAMQMPHRLHFDTGLRPFAVDPYFSVE